MKNFSFDSSKILRNPMKKELTIIGASLTIAAVAALSMAQSSSAQDLRSKYSRQTVQILSQADSTRVNPAPGSLDPNTPVSNPGASGAQGAAITPGSKAGNLPAQYGIVRSVSGDTLSVRMLDGTIKQVPATGNLSSSLGTLQRGSVVGFDTDANGNMTTLQAAEVDKSVSGTVSSINGDQVTVLSSSGESLTTPMSSATIARMGLVPGKELIVTTYKGTWATKVCCPETPAPVSNIVPEPAPQPPVGAPFTPPPPKPVQGLW